MTTFQGMLEAGGGVDQQELGFVVVDVFQFEFDSLLEHVVVELILLLQFGNDDD